MTAPGPSGRPQAWPLFDRIVEQAAAGGYRNPWVSPPKPAPPDTSRPDATDRGAAAPRFEVDLRTLQRLLAVPIMLNAPSTTGIPALALDVWVAYELRRAGFDADAVWPRASAPRVLPSTVSQMLDKATVADREALDAMTRSGRYAGAFGASANILGKNYVKQVDVVISAWNTGPELMISTKRMDSSLGNNAANRVEESYGDAANLRARHPQAALGFVYSLGSAAIMESRPKAEWLIDLLGKLGRHDDAYDAVALLVPELSGGTLGDDDQGDGEDRLKAAGLVDDSPDEATIDGLFDEAVLHTSALDPQLAALPTVRLLWDDVPPRLRPEAFFQTMVTRVLDNSPITFHREARRRLAHPVA